MILHCAANPEIAKARVAHRRIIGGDPSDADSAVLDSPWQVLEPLEAEEMPAVVRIGHGEDLESLMANLR